MSKRVVFAADDDNESVRAVREHIASGYDIVDLDSGADWPEMAHQLGQVVSRGDADLGVVMCWTGTGTAIAANKVRGVRAAQASDGWIAGNARRWNDANVLALSTRRLAAHTAVECVEAFLQTDDIDPDERDRIDELIALDDD